MHRSINDQCFIPCLVFKVGDADKVCLIVFIRARMINKRIRFNWKVVRFVYWNTLLNRAPIFVTHILRE